MILSAEQRNQRGMTVIELVIAVVVLGAIFLFTLRGTTVVTSMRAIAVGHQLQDLQTRVLAYQSRFGELPGDDPAAAARFNLPPAVALIGGRGVSTAGNGRIDGRLDDNVAANAENFMAWRHMRAAAIVEGDADLAGASARPENPFGGIYGFDENNLGFEKGALCGTRIPGAAAFDIDKRLDDGVINRGSVRATSRFSPEEFNHFDDADSQAYDVEKEYIICVPVLP